MNIKKNSAAKEIMTLLWWNFLFYLAYSTLLGSQFNIAGVYGLV
jgi:hypothetical protein